MLLGGAAASGAEVELDDPAARLRATREWYGDDVAGRARILDAARMERDRYAIGQGGGGSRANALSATSGGAFVSLGPTRADFAVNGIQYSEIDSGRVRQILAHPMDPDVLFIATAGGGVWKTYTATAPTVLWEPLTDALGSTAVGTLAMDPSNPDILFLGFGDPFDVQQPGITRSTDGGGTWSAPAILTATPPPSSRGAPRWRRRRARSAIPPARGSTCSPRRPTATRSSICFVATTRGSASNRCKSMRPAGRTIRIRICPLSTSSACRPGTTRRSW